MKRRTYTYLISLAVVAMLGSMAVQAVWIYRSYEQSRRHLRERLTQALAATIEDIAVADGISLLAVASGPPPPPDAPFPLPPSSTSYSYVYSDDSLEQTTIDIDSTGEVLQMHVVKRKKGNVFFSSERMDSVITQASNGQINVEVSIDNGMTVEQIRYQEDSLVEHILDAVDDGRFEMLEAFEELKSVMREPIEMVRDFDSLPTDFSKNLIKKIENEVIWRHKDWRNRLHFNSFKEKLMSQLEEHELDQQVSFAVVDGSGEPFEGYKSETFTQKPMALAVTLPLFPDDLKEKGLFATVGLPSIHRMALAEIWGLLALSAFFMTLLVIVFAATIRNLLSQSKLSQLKSDFINNMGHELKTPLATISLAADAINHPSTIDQPDKVRSFTGMIQQERERMYAHIERVLQMAQSESGQFTISKRPVEVADLVHGAVACVQAQIDQSNAEVHLSLPDHPVSIKADREHLEAALVNLIDNALKYNDQTPIVHLTVKALPTETHVAVHDNGIGISKENQRHVFSRFFRAQSGNLHGVKGFGLGLSYVQAVAMAHGGKVTLESELDMGSTFTIKLPNA